MKCGYYCFLLSICLLYFLSPSCNIYCKIVVSDFFPIFFPKSIIVSDFPEHIFPVFDTYIVFRAAYLTVLLGFKYMLKSSILLCFMTLSF